MGWAVAVYYQVERRGPPLPDGPVLVVANHPNALVDPMVLFRTAGRPTRPLAKAPLFQQALVGTVLRGLGGLPVYRRQDDPKLMGRNERTFDAAVEALQAGGAVQIYPEGQSHSEPALTPLKTGAARIAFLTEERSGWSCGLRIVPVGLTYQRKHLFRGKAVATVGEALVVNRWRSRYEADGQEAVRALTAELTDRLAAVTLNLEDAADRPLLDVAERLYAREKGEAGWRERKSLGHRLPRLQAFARGLAWIRANDPEGHARMRASVESYVRLHGLLGVRSADVPASFRPGAVARFLVREGFFLGVLSVPALVATVAWVVPYWIPRWVVASARPKHDAVSTYKLGAAILAFPLMWGVWGALAYVLGGPWWGLAALGALPLAGLAWVAWIERWRRVSEDVRVFLRSAPRRRVRERLRGLRARLVADFENVAALLPEDDEATDG